MNNLLPQKTRIISIKDLTCDTRLIKLDLKDFDFKPGQFIMVSVLGYGEGPFSISSSPTERNFLELTIRKVGRLTEAIFDLVVGEHIFIRGPYGNGYNLTKLKNKKVTLISGGCGLAPLRSIVKFAESHQKYLSDLQILYGARTPKDILYSDEIKVWQQFAEVIMTVDQVDDSWAGNVGLITNLITNKIIHIKNSVFLMCGPPIMYQFVTKKLLELGISEESIFLSLERNMQCGVGLCQHCTCGDKYVCTDGPIFTLKEIRKLEHKND